MFAFFAMGLTAFRTPTACVPAQIITAMRTAHIVDFVNDYSVTEHTNQWDQREHGSRHNVRQESLWDNQGKQTASSCTCK